MAAKKKLNRKGKTGATPKKRALVRKGKPADAEATVNGKLSISKAVEAFICEVDSLADTLPIVMFLLGKSLESKKDKLDEFLKLKCTTTNGGKAFSIPSEEYQEFLNVRRKLERDVKAVHIVPRSFLTSLVSHYDAFLGNLVRSLLFARAELLNSSGHKLSFKELTTFSSIDDAREFIVEKEVESLLRESHAEQFKSLENKFGVVLTKDVQSWPTFIEVMERRNLFVHCNGIVSSQYLSVCTQHGVECSKTKLGEELKVTPNYFSTAYATIVVIGVKLAHVLWRSVRPDEMAEADNSLNEVSLNLIRDEKYALAKDILDFASQYKKYGDETIRRILILNRAQAYKWMSLDKKAAEILTAEDWGASSEKFQLANAVLNDRYKDAAVIMRRMGKNGALSKGDYKEWPIFKAFRGSPDFTSAYKDVFQETFGEVKAEEISTQPGGNIASDPTIQ